MKICTATMSRQNARKGFTTLLVIASMVLLSGAVMGMSTLFAHEIERTRAVRAQIQLRQLLLAAIPAARQEIATNGIKSRDVEIHVPLEEALIKLHVMPAQAGSEVTVIATFKNYKSAETLFFSPNIDLTGATLTRTQGE